MTVRVHCSACGKLYALPSPLLAFDFSAWTDCHRRTCAAEGRDSCAFTVESVDAAGDAVAVSDAEVRAAVRRRRDVDRGYVEHAQAVSALLVECSKQIVGVETDFALGATAFFSEAVRWVESARRSRLARAVTVDVGAFVGAVPPLDPRKGGDDDA